MQHDSVDKIIQHYFACITRKPFSYKGKEYVPRPLRVSPSLLCGYTCPPNCGGCCFRVTLDWLPGERMPSDDRIVPRTVTLSGKTFVILSDLQEDFDDKHCRHRRPVDGRCEIHFDGKPMAAEFELIRFLVFEPPRANTLTTKLFGRGWSYERVDGGRGALCEITDRSDETVASVKHNLGRLKQWADHFELEHVLDEVLEWIDGPATHQPYTFNKEYDGVRGRNWLESLK